MADQDVQFWPEDLLTTAAACFIMADTAWREWRLGKFANCLAIAHAAQQAMARFDALEALPATPKAISEDTAHLVLRGVPTSNHTITQVDGSGSGETPPFYEASFMTSGGPDR